MFPRLVSNLKALAVAFYVTGIASTCLIQTLRLPQDLFPEESLIPSSVKVHGPTTHT
jgi:hypothetical protein